MYNYDNEIEKRLRPENFTSKHIVAECQECGEKAEASYLDGDIALCVECDYLVNKVEPLCLS